MNSKTQNLSKHCELCSKHIVTFDKGIICGLTSERPEFDENCSKIDFSNLLEKKIIETNITFEKLALEKKWAYAYFILFASLGIGMFFFTYFFANYISNIISQSLGRPTKIYPSIIIIFIAIGFVLLNMAFGAINRHLYDAKTNSKIKKELDTILSLYNISYQFKVRFIERINRETEAVTELKIIKK